MNKWRECIRKGLPPPILLFLFLLFDVWSSWPALTHLDDAIILSWQLCAAAVTGGLSLYLALSGLLALTRNQTTLNALHPERTCTLVTEGCYRFSRNPVYLGFVGLHLTTAYLLGSLAGLVVTPLLIISLATLHIQIEEAGMRRLFGLQWEHYCHRTPRWFSCVVLLRSIS